MTLRKKKHNEKLASKRKLFAQQAFQRTQSQNFMLQKQERESSENGEHQEPQEGWIKDGELCIEDINTLK